MNKLSKYIIAIAICAIIGFIAWYFSSILISILVAAVFSLIGKPIMSFLRNIKIGKVRMPSSLAAIFTIVFLVAAISAFFFFLIPLAGELIEDMSKIDFNAIRLNLAIPLAKYDIMLHRFFPTMDPNVTIESLIMSQIQDIINFNLFTDFFSSVTSFIMDFVITAFTVIFTSFFFLKDENMFTNMIIGIVPTRYEDNTKRVLHSVNNLLVRYFTGITLETVCITLLNTTGLYLIGGISFKLAVILAFISGVLNVIPYIGPIFAGLFGIIMSVISLYGGVSDPRLGVLLIKLISIFICTHIIDILVFQPFIYSNSIKAHPLEIFIVILMAGQLGGIFGMLIAIPTYTVLRVFAKEFFNRFKIVRELTDKIE